MGLPLGFLGSEPFSIRLSLQLFRPNFVTVRRRQFDLSSASARSSALLIDNLISFKFLLIAVVAL